MPISSLMSRDVVTVSLEDTVAEVEACFAEQQLGWAPVVDEHGTLMGVLSNADLVRFRAGGRDLSAVPAWQLSTYGPITVSPDTPARTVAQRMVETAIHHVVVTDEGRIVGVVSALDFVRAYAGGPEA
ncbi:MAG TPA: CBS domain-containing protein [Caldimonas sp.]|nr:CBS domain-containing protein [Caldimonas sp.]